MWLRLSYSIHIQLTYQAFTTSIFTGSPYHHSAKWLNHEDHIKEHLSGPEGCHFYGFSISNSPVQMFLDCCFFARYGTHGQ